MNEHSEHISTRLDQQVCAHQQVRALPSFSFCRQFGPSSCSLKSFHVHGTQSSSEKSHLNIV